MRTLLCSKKQPQRIGCFSFILTAFQYLDSSLNPLQLLKQQMKEKISKLEYMQVMIQSDMEEIMIRHMELLVKIAELEGSMLQVDRLMPPRTTSIGMVSWGSPEECYTESDCIYDELKPPRKVETKDTSEKDEKKETLTEGIMIT